MRPRVKPLGIGDLKVVKLQLLGLRPGEPAHIETIMPFETRSREHRRLRRTEETRIEAVERTTESVHELETTERFQIEQEAQKVQKSETKFEAGATISAGFGPVQIGAYARYSSTESTELTDKIATDYAKQTMARSLERVVEKLRSERIFKTLDEIEEKNLHAFANTEGEGKSGIYFWVNKRYRAKCVNYGKRLFYEFIAPHPAAFYNFAQLAHASDLDPPLEPLSPTNPGDDEEALRPDHITRDNYAELVGLHGAEGVQAPPPAFAVLVRTIAREQDQETAFAVVDEDLEVPEGYNLASWYSALQTRASSSGVWWFDRSIGTRIRTASSDTDAKWFGPSNATATGIIPIALQGFGIRSCLLTINAYLTLQPEALADWQLRTYAAIMAAYAKAKQTFDEAVAAAQIQKGVEIGGHNPARNREIMVEELQKACITLWTGFQFNAVPTIDHDEDAEEPGNFPRINVVNAEETAPEVAFLNQAFDWRNMTFEFYPYVWASRDDWLDLHAKDDPDPLFASFRRAGAARVLVPVHLELTDSVLYYQLTGALRFGEDIPLFDQPDFEDDLTFEDDGEPPDTELALYTAFMDEIYAGGITNTINEDVEISEDDPDAWEVEEPTSLVWLKPDSDLTLPEETA